MLVLTLLTFAVAQENNARLDPRCGPSGDPRATPIHEIQGPGERSPLQRRRASVEGVVTATFQGNDAPFGRNLGGFFLQTVPGAEDDDPATSEGLLVQSVLPVEVGRIVRASGTVMEEYGMTVLTAVRETIDCGASADLPAAHELTLPFASHVAPEPLEEMRVHLPQALVISEYYNYDRYGELVLALPQDRFLRPIEATQLFTPDDPRAAGWAAAQELRRITLDDGGNEQNPSPVRLPSGEIFTLDRRFRGGDQLAGVQGPLHYAYGTWRIQPTGPAVLGRVNPAPLTPPSLGGDLTVAAMNVQNYFVDVGETCGPKGDMECRGADDANELERQRAKIVAAILAMDAEIVGLVELQNAPDDRAVRDLAEALTTATQGMEPWAYVETGAMGTDAIAQGIVYRADRVRPIGTAAVLDDDAFVDPRATGLGKNRPALAHAFAAEGGDTHALTVVVNHFKSKGSECGAGDDHPLQGSCSGTRTDAARALLAWLDADPTGTGAPWLLIGDLNAYPKEDPITAFLAGLDGVPGTGDDAVDLLAAAGVDTTYTFVFDGRYGRLDHAIAHPDLAARVAGAAPWAINADEVDLINYDLTYKQPAEGELYAPDAFRASDHDPVLIGIDLP